MLDTLPGRNLVPSGLQSHSTHVGKFTMPFAQRLQRPPRMLGLHAHWPVVSLHCVLYEPKVLQLHAANKIQTLLINAVLSLFLSYNLKKNYYFSRFILRELQSNNVRALFTDSFCALSGFTCESFPRAQPLSTHSLLACAVVLKYQRISRDVI